MPMSGEVIVGLITAASAVGCQLIISFTGRNAARQERAESQNLIVYRLEQLERKVTMHNSVIERTYKLEQENEITKEKISSLKEKVEELEKSI